MRENVERDQAIPVIRRTMCTCKQVVASWFLLENEEFAERFKGLGKDAVVGMIVFYMSNSYSVIRAWVANIEILLLYTYMTLSASFLNTLRHEWHG